jgi:hypothetical protein
LAERLLAACSAATRVNKRLLARGTRHSRGDEYCVSYTVFSVACSARVERRARVTAKALIPAPRVISRDPR